MMSEKTLVAEAARFQKLLAQYFTEFLPNRRSEETIAHYRSTITIFLKWLSMKTGKDLGRLSFVDVTKENLEAYMKHLLENKKLHPESVNNYASSVRSFLKYTASCDPCISVANTLLADKVKEPKKMMVRYVEPNIIYGMISSCDLDSEKGRRDCVFMMLMFDTAARLDEMLNLRIRDIVFSRAGTVMIIEKGKGGKSRNVPVSKNVAERMSDYISQVHKSSVPDDFLFQEKKPMGSVPLTPYLAQRIVSLAADRVRVKTSQMPARVTCHMFRHSRAMQLYRRGMDLTLISQFLGHSSITTTLIYAHADTEMKRKAINKATEGMPELEQFSSKLSDKERDNAFLKLVGLKN